MVLPEKLIERIPLQAFTLLAAFVAYTVTIVIWGTRLDSRVNQLLEDIQQLRASIAHIDDSGSRASSRRLELFEERQNANNHALSELQSTVRESVANGMKSDNRIFNLEGSMRRNEDRDDRIVKVLDNVYNLLNEHMRLPHTFGPLTAPQPKNPNLDFSINPLHMQPGPYQPPP